MKLLTNLTRNAVFIIIFCAVFIPSITSAYSLTEAKEQIRSLTAEIVSLRNQIGALALNATTTKSTTTLKPFSTLSTCTITSFTATLPSGYGVYSYYHNLYWTTNGCASVTINGVSRALSGSIITPIGSATVAVQGVNQPRGTVTYTLIATGGSNGTQTKSVVMYYPHLDITVSPTTPTAQNIAGGVTNVKLADFNLTLSTNVMAQTLYELYAHINCAPYNTPNPFKNVRFMIGATQIAQVATLQPCVGSYSYNTIKVSDQNISFIANETKKVSMYADIASTAVVDSNFTFGLSGILQNAYSDGGYAHTVNLITITSPVSDPDPVLNPESLLLCTITSFIATPNPIPLGGTTTLSWSTKGCGRTITINGVTYPSSGTTIKGLLFANTVYTLTGTPGGIGLNCSLSLCTSRKLLVTVNPPVANTCTINSFTVPASTTIASRLSATVSWSSNCALVNLIADSGSYYLGYVGGSTGSYTFSMPANTTAGSYSTKDTIMNVTLIGGKGTDVTSITKSIPITDITNTASQCAFTSLIATPSMVSSSIPKTILSWQTPAGCLVYINSWIHGTTGLVRNNIFKPGTYYFNASDSVEVTPTSSTSYYLLSQAGVTNPPNSTVNSAKSIDVKKQ